MVQANLSETLFKPSFKHQETSTLVRRARHHEDVERHSALEGRYSKHWYRTLNHLMWIWRGVDPREIEEVLARITVSTAKRSNEHFLDTVVGYRSGNWIYEWAKQGAAWQTKAMESEETQHDGHYWLNAANLYSIAAYPYIKGDELAEQAQTLANRAYEEAANYLPYQLKALDFSIEGGGNLRGFLHLPEKGSAPFPTVLMCGTLDMLQSDYYRLFRDYLAPAGMAMLTIDVPSVGFSSRWKLSEDSSFLDRQVLRALPDIPWVDHCRVGAFGFRFCANIAVRLAYLDPGRLRGVATLGPIVHHLLCDTQRQHQVPDMYMDVLASRLGMANATDAALKTELGRYSLKTQWLLGHRCQTPMLAGYWDNDLLCPKEEASLIVNSSTNGKLLPIKSAPIYRNFHQALGHISDWLKDALNA